MFKKYRVVCVMFVLACFMYGCATFSKYSEPSYGTNVTFKNSMKNGKVASVMIDKSPCQVITFSDGSEKINKCEEKKIIISNGRHTIKMYHSDYHYDPIECELDCEGNDIMVEVTDGV